MLLLGDDDDHDGLLRRRLPRPGGYDFVTPATPDASRRRLDDCSQVGYGDICPDSDAERLYTIIAMVIGGAFYGYIIGNISSIVSTTDANSRAYFEKMDLIHT